MFDEYRRFYKLRRMFAIIDDTVLIAPQGLCQTHSEWLRSFGLEKHADTCTRGYFHAPSNVVAFYSGAHFYASNADIAAFREHAHGLILFMNVPPEAEIWASVKSTLEPGNQWPAREVLGHASDFYTT